MELTRRPVEERRDRDFVFDLKILANQACGNPRERAIPPEEYRSHWLGTAQPDEFWAVIETSRSDPRTIADVWLEAGRRVGWAWVTFRDVRDYGVTIAELEEIAVVANRQREGVGGAMLHTIIGMARDKGATVLRSETAIGNTASLLLHAGGGLRVSRVAFSMELTEGEEEVNRLWLRQSVSTLRWLADRLDAADQTPADASG